jgi:hypothetical protein
LKTDATKDEGMNVVAKYHKAEQDWNDYQNSIGMHHTRPEKYFNLLMIVKTKSDIDNVWVISLMVNIDIQLYYSA